MFDEIGDAFNEFVDEAGQDIIVTDNETKVEKSLKCRISLVQSKETNFTSDLSQGSNATLTEGDAKANFKNIDAQYLKEDNHVKYIDPKTGYEYKFRMLKPTTTPAGSHIEVALKKRE